jgi:hypothetical protein
LPKNTAGIPISSPGDIGATRKPTLVRSHIEAAVGVIGVGGGGGGKRRRRRVVAQPKRGDAVQRIVLYIGLLCLPRIIRKTIADSIPNRTPSAKSVRKPIPTAPQGNRAHGANIANGGTPPIAPPQIAYVKYPLKFFFLKKK